MAVVGVLGLGPSSTRGGDSLEPIPGEQGHGEQLRHGEHAATEHITT